MILNTNIYGSWIVIAAMMNSGVLLESGLRWEYLYTDIVSANGIANESTLITQQGT